MNNTKKFIILAGTVIFTAIIICIYFFSQRGNNHNKELPKENTNKLSTWVVYWDLNKDKENRAINEDIKNLCYFGVNFSADNKLVIPEKLIDYYDETRNSNFKKYITIVNDKLKKNGSYLLKDTSLLSVLLSNPESRSKHEKEIVDLAVKYDFDGVEIDYEQIKNNMNLWENYILFIKELYEKTEQKGLKLRIVLEPNIPFDKLNFSKGPTYVVMCYNLHGGFSGPGEKSNPHFIKSIIEKTKNIPGNKSYAIPNGGYDWAANGKTTPITEANANFLIKNYNPKISRDYKSKCLFFKYTDEEKVEHEVWYADKTTLKAWMKVITQSGYDISIWRL